MTLGTGGINVYSLGTTFVPSEAHAGDPGIPVKLYRSRVPAVAPACTRTGRSDQSWNPFPTVVSLPFRPQGTPTRVAMQCLPHL